jgi:hypothetical protein
MVLEEEAHDYGLLGLVNALVYEALDMEDEPELLERGLDKGLRKYAGVIGGDKLMVNAVGDHLFLSRVYISKCGRKKIKLDWRFNREGRIDILDSRTYPEGKTDHVLVGINWSSGLKNWNNKWFITRHIDERVSLIEKDFFERERHEQYATLLRFGHDFMRNVYNRALINRIITPNKILEDQVSLQCVLDDVGSMSIIRKAARIYPKISDQKEGQLKVWYDKAY